MTLSEYLTQNQIKPAAFARQIGTSRQSIHRWTVGLSRPRAQEMRRIAEATGGKVTANDFYEVAA